MSGRVFVMMAVATTFIAASIDSGAAASWRRSRSMSRPPSPSEKSTLLDLKFALCRCATVLDPCFYGNHRMEVWDLMRKCFDLCPPQSQRCLAPETDEAKRQENDYVQLKEKNIMCYLNTIPFNETYFRDEIAAINTKCHRYVETTQRFAQEPWWSPLMTLLLFMAMP